MDKGGGGPNVAGDGAGGSAAAGGVAQPKNAASTTKSVPAVWQRKLGGVCVPGVTSGLFGGGAGVIIRQVLAWLPQRRRHPRAHRVDLHHGGLADAEGVLRVLVRQVDPHGEALR